MTARAPSGRRRAAALLALALALAPAARAQLRDASVEAAVETERPAVYVGEVFDLTLVIRSRGAEMGQSFDLAGMPPADVLAVGAYQELPIQRVQEQSTLVETRRFRAQARLLKAGSVAIEPQISLVLVERRRSLFGTSWSERPFTVRARRQSLTGRELPAAGRPDGFAGAVGTFAFTVDVAPTNVVVGDLVTATFRLRGKGMLDSFRPAPLAPGPAFKTYELEPLPPEPGSGVAFKQIVVPQGTNATLIPAASFAYFDPLAGTYRTTTQGPFRLTFHAAEVTPFEAFRPAPAAGGSPTAAAAAAGAGARKRMSLAARRTLAGAVYCMAVLAAAFWAARPAAAGQPRRDWRRRALAAGAVVALGAALFVPARLAGNRFLGDRRLAVAAADCPVRFAPSEGALETFRLPAGRTCEELETWRGWVKIAWGNRRGWLPASALQRAASAAGDTAP